MGVGHGVGIEAKSYDRNERVCLADDRSMGVWMTGDRSRDHVTGQKSM